MVIRIIYIWFKHHLLIHHLLGQAYAEYKHSSIMGKYNLYSIIQIYFGISCGRVLNGELYAQILQKLIFLDLSISCFVKFSLRSSGLYSIYLYLGLLTYNIYEANLKP